MVLKDTNDYFLPPAAVATLSDPGLKLVLHCITFSHYCNRARWTLRLLGIPYEEVNYLPMLHIPGMIRLLRRFHQGPGQRTASSASPAATPCLAIYSAAGQPLCLLQDSSLICRYAVLRSAALALPYASDLYGPGLALAQAHPDSSSSPPDSSSPQGAGGDDTPGSSPPPVRRGVPPGSLGITGGDGALQDLEARMNGTLGIEVRRLIYYHLLPLPSVGGALFINNSSNKLVARLVYYFCRLTLPKVLKVNSFTAERGRGFLLEEFDLLDRLLEQSASKANGHRGAEAPQAAAAATIKGGVASAPAQPPRLPYYLLGDKLTVVDIQVACLAAPLLCLPDELSTMWLPGLEAMPPDFKALVQDLQKRPTGRFVLDMWRVHGPLAAAGMTHSNSAKL